MFLLKQLIASEQHIYLMTLKGTEKEGRHEKKEKKQLFWDKKEETNWKHWDASFFQELFFLSLDLHTHDFFPLPRQELCFFLRGFLGIRAWSRNKIYS